MDLVEDKISGMQDNMTAFMSQISIFMDSMRDPASQTHRQEAQGVPPAAPQVKLMGSDIHPIIPL